MQISNILKQEAVRVIGAASSKKRLFQEVAEVAQAAYGLKAQLTVEALLDRESLGPTGVGHGVALPHARSRTVSTLGLALGTTTQPIDFPSGDDRCAVQMICLIAIPAHAPDLYLSLLASLARTLADADLKHGLLHASSASEMHRLLTEPQLH